MRKHAIALAAIGLLAAPAIAQTPLGFADVDTDGNGELSYGELQMVWPDLTQEEFSAADIDLSNGLSADELNSLQPSAVSVPAPGDAPAAVPTPTESLSNTKGD